MTGSEQFPPFVFVLGAGRSGTSVLRSVLDGHSQLAVSHEGRFVFPLSRRRSRYERADGFDVDAFAADLLADPAVRGNLGLEPDDVRTALGGAPIVNYPDAVRRVFAYYASQRGKSRYGDKMPAYVQRIPTLAAMFPEGRFVHIIRDGRDVALSTMAIPGERQDPVALGIDWRRRVEAGRTAGARLGARRYHEVRYERLVADPEEPVAELCRFLDLDYEPEMLQFFERRDNVPAKVRANPRHARLAEPLSSGARSWRTDMQPADLERFEVVAGELLVELGYERGAPRPSVTARAAAAWGRVRWSVHGGGVRLPGVVRRALGRTDRPSARP
jgi:hypothetical protein